MDVVEKRKPADVHDDSRPKNPCTSADPTLIQRNIYRRRTKDIGLIGYGFGGSASGASRAAIGSKRTFSVRPSYYLPQSRCTNPAPTSTKPTTQPHPDNARQADMSKQDRTCSERNPVAREAGDTGVTGDTGSMSMLQLPSSERQHSIEPRHQHQPWFGSVYWRRWKCLGSASLTATPDALSRIRIRDAAQSQTTGQKTRETLIPAFGC
ncbi:hypothetical protein PMIN01_04088 [Paraphaeosphaeria minitans]|uniref:Uncharacterized protein n=1 Tax=Paraphaeosphaeria minitans TaxID=565426 RepID=A0A9P6KU01_9PLEO|nr:hypothetical protein PMIN01_04088 [Paraphaeosphaeria minitans]